MTTPTPRPDTPARLNLLQAVVAGVSRLPNTRAAIEGLILFLLVVAAGVWGAYQGVLVLSPASKDKMLWVWVGAFFIPALGEELAFRSWVPPRSPLLAVISLLLYLLWHPVQTLLHLPFGRPEFLDPGFMSLVAVLGLACTLSRIRSGSIWPAVVIHWGAVVVWRALFAGPAG